MKALFLGYSGRKPEELQALVESVDGILVDVRFSPYSRYVPWSRAGFEARMPERYFHAQVLGNANYKNGGPIRIVDYVMGKHILESIIARGKTPVLMCGCADPAECHRTVIAAKLAAEGWEVEEVANPRARPTSPSKPKPQSQPPAEVEYLEFPLMPEELKDPPAWVERPPF